jgi:signal transduction histidine kinase
VKFTPENGSIMIRIEDLDSSLQVSVMDSGNGIDPSLEEKIFKLHKNHHSGIGLYLCSEFINRLGGRIWSESSHGQGGVFHFTIPKTHMDSAHHSSSARNPTATSAANTSRISLPTL